LLGYLINPNVSPSLATNGVTYERLTSLTSITSTASVNDGSNEDSVRICLLCEKYLQRRYDRIRFHKIEKDEAFRQYEVNHFLLIYHIKTFLLENS
jgi:hypothetical protein